MTIGLEEILESLRRKEMLGPDLARDEEDVEDPPDLYAFERGTSGGTWQDQDQEPFKTCSLFHAIALKKPPVDCPGASKAPFAYSWSGRYAPKSKYDYVPLPQLGIDQRQAWHLSFAHERVHVDRTWSAFLLMDHGSFTIDAATLISAGWLSIHGASSWSVLGFLVSLPASVAFRIWHSAHQFAFYRTEEIASGIGAAILTSQSGVTSKFTDYSAAYVSGCLGQISPSDRRHVVEKAYRMATRRVETILAGLAPWEKESASTQQPASVETVPHPSEASLVPVVRNTEGRR